MKWFNHTKTPGQQNSDHLSFEKKKNNKIQSPLKFALVFHDGGVKFPVYFSLNFCCNVVRPL